MDSPGSTRKGRNTASRKPTHTPAMAQTPVGLETPSRSRMRTRHLESSKPVPDEANNKGGRSLRKRTRIDYKSFDQPEDDEAIEAKATPTTRSIKKRKSEISFQDGDFEEDNEPRVKRRVSEQPPKTSSRRTPARKSTIEPQPFVPEQPEEDVPVQDVIEVGGHHSEHSSDSSFHQRTNSGSSHDDSHVQSTIQLRDMVQKRPEESQEPIQVAAPATSLAAITEGSSNESSAVEHQPLEEPQVAYAQSKEPQRVEPTQPELPQLASHHISVQATAPQHVESPSAEVQHAESQPTDSRLTEVHPAASHSIDSQSVKTPPTESQSSDAELAGSGVSPSSQMQAPKHSLTIVNESGRLLFRLKLKRPVPVTEARQEKTTESGDLVEEIANQDTSHEAEDQNMAVHEPVSQDVQDEMSRETHGDDSHAEMDEDVRHDMIDDAQPKMLDDTHPAAHDDIHLDVSVDSHPNLDMPIESHSEIYESAAVEMQDEAPHDKPHAAGQEPVDDVHETRVTVDGEDGDMQDDVNPYAYLTPFLSGQKVYYPAANHEPEDDTVAQGDEAVEEEGASEETPAGTPGEIETAMNSPLPDAPETDAPAKVQIGFRKLRPAEEYIKLLEGIESVTSADAHARMTIVVDGLSRIQKEYYKLRYITDDEDSAVKYRKEEASWQHRYKMALSRDPNAAEPARKEIPVKGMRAPKPPYMETYHKQQEKIKAMVYGDPIEQSGVKTKRLRDRPKQTAKAAEADDPHPVLGKRSRKAPGQFGEVESASRGSTPAAPLNQPRRRRGQQGALEEEPIPQPEAPAVEDTPKKRGRGGRPRKATLPEAIPEDVTKAEEDEEQPQPKRRRRNVAMGEELAGATNNGMNSSFSSQISGSATRRRGSRPTPAPVGEVATSSFYSTTTVPSSQPQDESRPATSSSTATVSTVGSYGLREKRQRSFQTNDNNEEEEEPRKSKRVRRATKKIAEDDAVMPFVPIKPSPAAPASMPKIRIKNHPAPASEAASSSFTSNPNAALLSPAPPVSHPNNGTGPSAAPLPGPAMPTTVSNGQGNNGQSNDMGDYETLSKSQKMSLSMKARWASGSMSGAVHKRRATLAAKKAAQQTPAPGATTASTPAPTGPLAPPPPPNGSIGP